MSRLLAVLPVCLATACASHNPATPAATAAAPTASTATSFATAGAPAALIASTSGATLLADDGPPISLTASDGTGLVLTSLEARAVVEGPLAFTELHLKFKNPLDRRIEGRFAITLPDGAALSRFAMKQDAGWQEAEVVERMAARRAYEDFLHRRQDPALLENEAGNQFSARVFPIAAKGEKELIVSFSHDVHGTYTLPLRGLPEIGHVEASVDVARPDWAAPPFDQVRFAQDHWKPDHDVAVTLAGAPSAIRAGELYAVAIDPLADAAPAKLDGLTILFDTSASRALGYAGQVENLMAMIGELARSHGAGLPITVAAFDQSVDEVYRGRAGDAASLKDALIQRQALGASDVAGALRWAAAHGAARRVVMVSDGVATVGDAAAVTAALATLKPAIDRLDVVMVGGIRDRDAAARLARGNFTEDGAVLDGARGPAEVARRLGLATRSGVKVQIDGARWVWPAVLDGVQPGDTQVILAAVDDRTAASGKLTVHAGAAVTTVAPPTVPRPLLQRAAASAEIARLTADRTAATDAEIKADLATRIVDLSTRNRVLSDLTALLVLETEADYARFGIPRTALADILAVGDKGIEVRHRGDAVLIAEPEPNKNMQKIAAEKLKKEDKSGGELDDALKVDPSANEWTIDGKDLDEGGHGDGNAPPPDEAPSADQPSDRAPGLATGASMGQGSGSGSAMGSSANQIGAIADPIAEPPPPPRPEPRAPEQIVARPPDGDPSLSDRQQSDAWESAHPKTAPWDGDFAAVMAQVQRGKLDDALASALAWRGRDAGDVLALVALGEVLEAKHMPALAARAYGSIIDLFPSRADLRRFAGERLERLGATGRDLAVDTYRQAVDSRPDHLTGHRLLAWALARQGDLPGAMAAIERGLAQDYPSDRFRGGTRILGEDLGVIAAAWIAKEPAKKKEIEARVAKAGGKVARDATLRFILYWETDANDVDFHIHDARGNHAYYEHKQLRSGGELYEDITTGYGPECFTITGAARSYPYQLAIHYYSRGPMGYGMGLLQIVRHDGKGGLAFEDRPYIVMVDGAFVDLGTVDGKTAAISSSQTSRK